MIACQKCVLNVASGLFELIPKKGKRTLKLNLCFGCSCTVEQWSKMWQPPDDDDGHSQEPVFYKPWARSTLLGKPDILLASKRRARVQAKPLSPLSGDALDETLKRYGVG